MAPRERARYDIVVCSGPVCGEKRGARGVFDELRAELSRQGVNERVRTRWQRCFGRCSRGPNALVRERATGAAGLRSVALSLAGWADEAGGAHSAMYKGLRPDDTAELVREHIVRGGIARRLVDGPPPAPCGEGDQGSEEGDCTGGRERSRGRG